MVKRLTYQDIEKISNQRRHILLKMENYKNVFSFITIFCQTCEISFETSVQSYKNAKQTGCPECKKKSISKVQKNKHVSLATRMKIGKANKNKLGSLLGITGKDHPAWKSGIDTRKKGSTAEACSWRLGVRRPYGNQCVLTGEKNLDNFNCHHLNNWVDFPEQRASIDNGVLITKKLYQKFP